MDPTSAPDLLPRVPRPPSLYLPGTANRDDSIYRTQTIGEQVFKTEISANSPQSKAQIYVLDIHDDLTPITSKTPLFPTSNGSSVENSPKIRSTETNMTNSLELTPLMPHFPLTTSSKQSSRFSTTSFMLSPHLRQKNSTEEERTLSDGTYEKGEFKNNLLHGKGYRKSKIVIKKDEIIEQVELIEQGQFENGQLIFGEKFTKDVYEEGHFVNGQLDGAGDRRYTNKMRETGLFKAGKLIQGTKSWENGTYDRGDFQDGLLTGKRCKRFYYNGGKAYGPFIRGIFWGIGVRMRHNLKFQVGYFRHNKLDDNKGEYSNFASVERHYQKIKKERLEQEKEQQRLNELIRFENDEKLLNKHSSSDETESSSMEIPPLLPPILGPRPFLVPIKKTSSLIL